MTVRSDFAGGDKVYWFEEGGVVHVTHLRSSDGRITRFVGSPDLGMCFDRLGRTSWRGVHSHRESERAARRGTRWSFQQQGVP
ncbi:MULTISPECIES: hypothetical protein [Nocardia]|uniref:hypothetical protein n=1 Tax=Nocardia TaxID=1817 RepID=UPI000D696A20|nr:MULTISPECIES: hypothetical protein [Nocardia]